MTAPVADLLFDGPAIDAAWGRTARAYLAAGTRTVGAVTRRAEQRLEDLTRSAAGGRLWRAWQSSISPSNNRAARDPVGRIWLKGTFRTVGAIEYMTRPGVLKNSDGGWLAIPLPAAGSRGESHDLTPEKWKERTGKDLRLVLRPGKAPLLVADDAILSGKRQVAQKNTPRRIAQGRGPATIPIFVLVRQRPFRNAFAIAPVLQRAEAEMPGEYAAQARKVSTGRL